ncbi:MAG: prepilin-type N-terminal cleavage/methylation domain-containing protein [Desulfobacterales bacterium]|jgi:prepilin-type N-terminal cleavage/methylation domain-containing protein
MTKILLSNNKGPITVDNGQRTTDNEHPGGFTLMELMVVMALLTIMLVFSVPRFHETLFLDESKTGSRWMVNKIQSLKEAAVRNQRNYTLHFDLDTDHYWETEDSMSDQDLEDAAMQTTPLPDGLKIADIEFPVRGKVSSGRTDITFYKNGYSDKALIHAQDGELYVSYLIEPFLSEVTRYDTYARFDN